MLKACKICCSTVKQLGKPKEAVTYLLDMIVMEDKLLEHCIFTRLRSQMGLKWCIERERCKSGVDHTCSEGRVAQLAHI